MRITRIADAPSYNPPLHTGVQCRRLQGHEAGPTEKFWVGLSVYPPGSSARMNRPPARKPSTRFSTASWCCVRAEKPKPLRKQDSVHFKKGEVRSVKNESSADATLLVSIAIPQAAQK